MSQNRTQRRAAAHQSANQKRIEMRQIYAKVARIALKSTDTTVMKRVLMWEEYVRANNPRTDGIAAALNDMREYWSAYMDELFAFAEDVRNGQYGADMCKEVFGTSEEVATI